MYKMILFILLLFCNNLMALHPTQFNTSKNYIAINNFMDSERISLKTRIDHSKFSYHVNSTFTTEHGSSSNSYAFKKDSNKNKNTYYKYKHSIEFNLSELFMHKMSLGYRFFFLKNFDAKLGTSYFLGTHDRLNPQMFDNVSDVQFNYHPFGFVKFDFLIGLRYRIGYQSKYLSYFVGDFTKPCDSCRKYIRTENLINSLELNLGILYNLSNRIYLASGVHFSIFSSIDTIPYQRWIERIDFALGIRLF